MMRKKDESTGVISEHQHIDTLIGAHSSFKGELAFEGAVRVDGVPSFVGEFAVEDVGADVF